MEIVFKNPADLTPYTNNAKIHTTEQIDKIASQIAAFGFDQPIVVDAKGVIIKGHGRREAALRLQLKKVPVVVKDLDEHQARAARIGDNKVAEAPWDPEMLKIDLSSLQVQGIDLELTAIDPWQIEGIINPTTSRGEFSERDHLSVPERKEGYDNSDFRQLILVMTPERFEKLMTRFAELQVEFGIETNLEVVEKLLELYDNSTDSK